MVLSGSLTKEGKRDGAAKTREIKMLKNYFFGRGGKLACLCMLTVNPRMGVMLVEN